MLLYASHERLLISRATRGRASIYRGQFARTFARRELICMHGVPRTRSLLSSRSSGLLMLPRRKLCRRRSRRDERAFAILIWRRAYGIGNFAKQFSRCLVFARARGESETWKYPRTHIHISLLARENTQILHVVARKRKIVVADAGVCAVLNFALAPATTKVWIKSAV